MPTLQLIETTQAPPGPNFSEEEVQAMQRAVINLFDRWDVNDEQAAILLGGIASRTYQRWKTNEYGRVGVDLAARLSNLLGIHKALRLLFKDADRGYRWIKSPNATFDNLSALDVMLGGQLTDLMRVRRYLDTVRSPW
jgi:uncharacterized protein (DUF2384 family)